MENFIKKTNQLKIEFKNLISDFISNNENCKSDNLGLKQAEIFRLCNMGFGNQKNCTESQQVFYLVAILRELEKEGKITRDPITKKWKLRQLYIVIKNILIIKKV